MNVTKVREARPELSMEINVFLRPFYHHNEQHIGIYFPHSPNLNKIMVEEVKARWSNSKKAWYVPMNKESYQRVCEALEGKAVINREELRNYLVEKKRTGESPKSEVMLVNTAFSPVQKLHAVSYKSRRIHPVNAHVLTLMEEQLKLRAYSPSTIRTYLQELSHLLVLLGDSPADDLEPEHLKTYLLYCYEILKLKENSLHSRINALKFYYEKVLHREKFFWDIPRPKKPLQLPKVLNENEIARLFNALTNLKHKVILFTAYSAGLRVSEVAALKLEHIDSGRMQIRIESAKGKKDRYVSLSPVLLDLLRAYIRTYKPRPRVYLFESEQTGTAYPTRSIQRIFQLARAKAGIAKEVGIHSLRHSFATHMLEKGIDIRYIKDLLGHFNIRTTERYLHVKREKLVNIISPFDDLWRSGRIEW